MFKVWAVESDSEETSGFTISRHCIFFFLICVCEDEVEKRNGPVRALFVSYTKRSLEAIFIF